MHLRLEFHVVQPVQLALLRILSPPQTPAMAVENGAPSSDILSYIFENTTDDQDKPVSSGVPECRLVVDNS